MSDQSEEIRAEAVGPDGGEPGGVEPPEACYRALVEHTTDAIVVVRQGKTIFCNPAAEQLLGLSTQEASNRSYLQIIAPDHLDRAREYQRRRLAGEELPELFEIDLIVDQSRRITVEVRQRFIEYGGEPATMLSLRDITERRRVEQALAAAKERLAVTVRGIRDAVITVEPDGGVALLNGAAERLTGWAQRQVLGRPVSEVVPLSRESDPEGTLSLAAQLAQLDHPMDRGETAVLRARDGATRLVSVTAAPIVRRDGSRMGSVFVLRDITEQRRVEEELLRTQRLESVGQLAGGIAHDFNNILTALTGSLSLARARSADGGVRTEDLDRVERAVGRAKDLTLQLLTFAKGGGPIKRTVPINDLVKETVEFALRGSNVRYEFMADLDLWPVEVDEAQIGQVFHNLIVNAVQAMPDGGTVHVHAKNRTVTAAGDETVLGPGRYVEITVRDEGAGIASELLDQVFDFFFSTKEEGSGLGLASAHSIILRHDGHIRAEAPPGGGALFRVSLPASDKPLSDPPSVEGKAVPGRGWVLVVDDESAIRLVAAEMLAELGYQAEAVGDGREALERFTHRASEDRPHDMVIMDLTIPGGMGGKELALELRKRDQQVRLIVSSGYSTDPIMSDHRRHGFDGVLRKPYDLAQLSRVLQAVERS